MSIAGGAELGKVFLERIDKEDSLESKASVIRDFVDESVLKSTSLHSFERNLLDLLLRVGHAATNVFLAHQGCGDLGETVEMQSQGTVFRSEAPRRRQLRTIFGEHEFFAFVYHRRLNPKTPILLRPIDAQLGISTDRWSPLLQEFSTLLCNDESFGPTADTFERVFRQQLSVDSLERVSRSMGPEAGVFMDTLKPPPIDEEGVLLVETADGKGVPMVHSDAVKLRSFEDKPTRPGNRRMATVASVYSTDRHYRTAEQIVAALFRDSDADIPEDDPPRPKPCHKRTIARLPAIIEEIDESEPVSGSLLALSWSASQVCCRRQPGQVLIRLMDGQHSLWNMAEACRPEMEDGLEIEILDIVHVSSYVWRAAKAFHTHRKHQEAFAQERLLRILHGEVKSVIRGLRHLATRRGLKGESRKEIDTICRYFEEHIDRMHYDEYLSNGYPIATGVIEGACRHLVKDRMERSGMRWTIEGAQAMLNIRALRQSSYWDEFHEQRSAADQQVLSAI